VLRFFGQPGVREPRRLTTHYSVAKLINQSLFRAERTLASIAMRLEQTIATEVVDGLHTHLKLRSECPGVQHAALAQPADSDS
jgi:hypothetical protein